MNENDFQENKKLLTVTPQQREFLKKNYLEYCFKNSLAPEKFISKHNKALIWVIFALSLAVFQGCMIYDISKGTSDISDTAYEDSIPDSSSDDHIYNDDNNDDSSADDSFKNTDSDINLSVVPKPSPDSENYTDSNGKYTSEGIAAAVRPSVVEIYTFSDKNYEQIYGTGSGIIMNTDGYIITNAHVLENSQALTAVTYDGSEHKASVVGRDAKTDLAVVKIDADLSLVPAEFGNSDEVVLGEQVMAIGNPGGLAGSITGGYVSGLNRKIKADSTGFEMNCIQTDAAISPGNSGGALVNMYGQVIGITSSKYVSSSYEGLGFAITINDAKPVIDELISNGYVSGRYKIGITFYGKGYAAAAFETETGFDYPQDIDGILITSLDDKCDISGTELQPWDFITEIEGKTVTDYDSVMDALEGKKADDTVKAHAVRITDKNGGRKEFDIQFRLMPDTSGDY